MRNRAMFSIEHLEPFKLYIVENGWTVLPTKGEYEVLRATHPDAKKPMLIYTRLATCSGKPPVHYTVYDESYVWTRRFIREKVHHMKPLTKRCKWCKQFIGNKGRQSGGHDKSWYCNECYKKGLNMEYEAMGLL